MIANKSLTYVETIAAIRAELDRLGCLDEGNWTGIIVNQFGTDGLPDGWASIGVNGAWSQCAPAADILDALQDADPAEFTAEAEAEAVDAGWLAAHAACNFSETAPGECDECECDECE